MALSDLKPSQMPLLLDALDAAATPVLAHLEPYGLVVGDLDTFRRSRTLGPHLAKWCQMTGMSPEALLVHRSDYFGFAPTADPSLGLIEERTMVAMYVAHRCTSGATSDRHAYYATEEMTALILAGSETSAEVSVTVDDLPSPSGVAYLARDKAPLVLMWQVLYGSLLSVQLVPARGAQEFIGHDGTRSEGWGYRFINHMYLPIPTAEAELSLPNSDDPPCLHEIGGFTPGMPDDVPRDEREIYIGWSSAEILEVLISFTHMLRQGSSLVETSQIAPRSSSARGRQATVTYLTHRARPSRPRGDDQEPTRVYSSRWVVRGHWRRQWYPSENRHRPIWISTYIAGPEGAPILTRDKVTIVRR